MSIIAKAQRLCTQLGSYHCSHFFIKRFKRSGGKSCCGGSGGTEEPLPMCTLTNTTCPGLAQCLKLDPTTKSKLIQSWSLDLRSNNSVDPTSLIK